MSPRLDGASRDDRLPPERDLDAPDWLERLRAADGAPGIGTLGRFEIHGEVGRGGQGVVYRATDPDTGRRVAVKRFVTAGRGGTGVHLRLQNEILATRALSHPGVVRILGVESDGECPLLVLEWIDGLPLNEWAAGDGTRPSIDAIVEMTGKVCEVLLHAHQRGVIHRDVKPSNVLVDAGGQPHVLDFGLAKLDGTSATTTSARFLGTLAYAAPELVTGGPAAVDARSDVYALGVILHEMLTGQLPYALGTSIFSAVEAIRGDEPLRMRAAGVDSALEAIVRMALAKAPEERYQSADALLADLRRYRRGEPVEARGRTAWESMRGFARRHPGPVTIVVTLTVASLVFGTTMAVLHQRLQRALARTQRIDSFWTAAFGGQDTPLAWSELDVEDVLNRASTRATAELRDEPDIEFGVRTLLARRYIDLGLWREVGRQCERALVLSGGARADEKQSVMALAYLGFAHCLTGHADGDSLLHRALELEQGRPASDPLRCAVILNLIARFHWGEQQPPNFAAAEIDYQQCFAALGRRPGPSHALLNAWRGFARMKQLQQQPAIAIPAFERALVVLDDLPDEPGAIRIGLLEGYADVLAQETRWAEAERAYRSAIELRGGLLDDRLPPCWAMLAGTVFAQGRAAEAMQLYHNAIVARCDRLCERFPKDRAQFQQQAAIVRREGLRPDQVAPFVDLLRQRAPDIEPLFRYTADHLVAVHQTLGDSRTAAALRAALDASVAAARPAE